MKLLKNIKGGTVLSFSLFFLFFFLRQQREALQPLWQQQELPWAACVGCKMKVIEKEVRQLQFTRGREREVCPPPVV